MFFHPLASPSGTPYLGKGEAITNKMNRLATANVLLQWLDMMNVLVFCLLVFRLLVFCLLVFSLSVFCLSVFRLSVFRLSVFHLSDFCLFRIVKDWKTASDQNVDNTNNVRNNLILVYWSILRGGVPTLKILTSKNKG